MQLFTGSECIAGEGRIVYCAFKIKDPRNPQFVSIYDPNKKILFHKSNLSQMSNNKTTKHFHPSEPFFNPVNHLFPANGFTIHDSALPIDANFLVWKIYQIDNLVAKKASRNKEVHLDKKGSHK